ncbi:DUF397 domain-containing protein [Streptomyces verrucosisporus]|uniref:DUF397 domain-containing protein n=1 Tax=Streptomyces verrucosisporus TaxID=1695161 RepID=UPI0019D179DC|nr:DUF397 domain-containing protein [Streptomyces verrucosisporus]MBN3928682.1 DUF397 domain-containing protein [Streptomyces verrucosisporus]
MTLKPSAGDGSELEWAKSSYSTNDGPDCVEVAATPGTAHVRDSKNAQGPRLAFALEAWAGFTAYAAGR